MHKNNSQKMRHSWNQMSEITRDLIQYTDAVLPVYKYYGDKTVSTMLFVYSNDIFILNQAPRDMIYYKRDLMKLFSAANTTI